jgi:long-chain acyl-CoA synthetase
MIKNHLRTISKLLYERTYIYANKNFLSFYEDNRNFSYESFKEKVDNTSNFMSELDISRGDVIGLLIPNSPEFLFILFGAANLGAIVMPLNYIEENESIKFKIKNSRANTLFVHHNYTQKLKEIEKDLNLDKIVIVETGANYEILLNQRKKNSLLGKTEVMEEDIAEIIYTSGTTHRPKGCLLTHHNIIIDAKGVSDRQKFDEKTRMMCVLPLFHVSAQIISTMAPLYAGGSIVLTEKFSASNFWRIIEKYKVNIANVVPTILFDLLNRKDHLDYDISSLNKILCGAAPLPIEIMKEFEKRFNIPVVETYGLTEGTCCSCANTVEKKKPGSVGIPLDINTVSIFDENDRELPPYEIGEIVIRGENVFKGYLNMPEETAKILRGGWLHTGDLGYKDDEGYIFITGRKKDIINRGGEKISPREIEEILYKHPLVKTAVVVRIKDRKYGERVGAVLSLRENTQNEGIKKEIREYCRANLASFKCPEDIFFIEELGLSEIPKGPSGKIIRKVLEDKIDMYFLENTKI